MREEQENYEEAWRHADRLVELVPDIALGWGKRADIELAMERYQAALDDYHKAAELAPEDSSWLRGQGFAQQGLGDADAAMAAFKQALVADPSDAGADYAIGVILVSQENYADALSHFDRVVKQFPQSADAWGNRGEARLGLGQYEEALADFRHASDLVPEASLGCRRQAFVLVVLGRIDEAEHLYRQALERQPSDIDAHYELGQLLLDIGGRAEEALVHLERCTELAPDVALVWNSYSEALISLGHFESALTASRHAIEVAPDDVDASLNEADALHGLGREDEAKAGYQAAAERDPTNPRPSFGLATIAEAAGDNDDALRLYSQTIELAPE